MNNFIGNLGGKTKKFVGTLGDARILVQFHAGFAPELVLVQTNCNEPGIISFYGNQGEVAVAGIANGIGLTTNAIFSQLDEKTELWFDLTQDLYCHLQLVVQQPVES